MHELQPTLLYTVTTLRLYPFRHAEATYMLLKTSTWTKQIAEAFLEAWTWPWRMDVALDPECEDGTGHLFIALNNGGGCSTVSSASPGVNTIKRGEMVSTMGGLVTPSGTLRHACSGPLGPGVQLHDIWFREPLDLEIGTELLCTVMADGAGEF